MSRRSLPRTFTVPRRLPGGVCALLLVGLLALMPACGAGGSGGEEADGAENAARSGPAAEPTPESAREPGPTAEPGPGTSSPTSTEIPEGGLEDWVEGMRQRLEVIELDPRASYPDVLRLYNTRHGAIERFYGRGGELTGDAHPELAAAIERQDSAFHELLELTGTTDYIERTHLLHAIRNVRLALEEVLDRARAAGVPLESTD